MDASNPAFIILLEDDASELSKKEDFSTFSKHSLPKEQEIIIVDSTEDESEDSLIKPLERGKKIKKGDSNPKKIKLLKHKPLFKFEEIHKNIRKTQEQQQLTEKNEETLCDFQRILPLVQEKDIRLGQKFQCTIPKFQAINENNSRLKTVLSNKVWDPSQVDQKDFEECKGLMQNILELNYFTDDYVCKFLAMHEYNVEETINYCFTNKDKLQREIIGSYIPVDPLFRKTRNSLYNKFLMRKV